ncbi:MAG: SBBP repeat-containing protein [Ignavibacteria bacterium]|nr:SBBP repeat-containing protein [Ignavibacteria bacterium]
MRSESILAVFLLLPAVLYSQINPEWIQRYNGEGNGSDEIYAMVADNSGNIYTAGRTTVTGNGFDFIVLKYSSSGVLIWSRTYNGTGNGFDFANAIAADNSGNIFITGESTGSGSNKDFVTIKYNSSGNEEWVWRYNGAGNSVDIPSSVSADLNGNCYVTGSTFGNGTSFDCVTIKYSSDGTQEWINIYNGPGNSNDAGNYISADNYGNVYVTGESFGVSSNFDYVTIKYNSSGNEIWNRRYNTSLNARDIGRALVIDGSENVIVTGESVGSGTNSDYATIKYDSSGTELWVNRYTGPASSSPDEARAITSDENGNIIVTGISVGNLTSYDFATVKYSSAGTELWVQRYNGPSNSFDEASSVTTDNQGNVYVSGLSFNTGTMDDLVVIKYNPDGAQQWLHRYNGTGNGNDNSVSVIHYSPGSLYACGSSTGAGTNFDAILIKYSELTGTGNTSSASLPGNYKLHQNYPNPFNPSTKIKYELNSEDGNSVSRNFVSLKVYDITGNKIRTLVNEYKNAGNYESDFSASDIPAGIYFCKMTVSDAENGNIKFSEARKLILLK